MAYDAKTTLGKVFGLISAPAAIGVGMAVGAVGTLLAIPFFDLFPKAAASIIEAAEKFGDAHGKTAVKSVVAGAAYTAGLDVGHILFPKDV